MDADAVLASMRSRISEFSKTGDIIREIPDMPKPEDLIKAVEKIQKAKVPAESTQPAKTENPSVDGKDEAPVGVVAPAEPKRMTPAEILKYTADTQPRDARGRFRQVLARIKEDLGTSGNQDALAKIAQVENLDFAGNYTGAVQASGDLLNIIDRLDSGALNSTSLENVRSSAAELGRVISNLPFAFGDDNAKIRYSDVPPALRNLMDAMIKRVEAKIGKKDSAKATKTLQEFKSGSLYMNQAQISSEMSTLLRLLT
jgi:hypothetical protein